MPVTIRTLKKRKEDGEKFSVLTAYDATFSRLISEAGVDAMLIGDSLGNVVQGRDSTVPVTLEQMVYHTECVARGNQGSLIIADVPFMGAATLERTLEAATALMQAGANVIKLEGGAWLADAVKVLKRNGIPVCAHLGLTPQAVNAFGGYRVQGKDEHGARELLEAACELDRAGTALFVLECVPRTLSAEITAAVAAPVIGIGAAPECDGQVLVMHDMLGLNPRPARFVKDFMPDGGGDVAGAFRAYHRAVQDGRFPADEHCF
ncbi:MAG: 3-methyl-2-oxobutanoate hydroxymethyltransferase [Alcanivorax sp.]|nr:3-methyl-2-oxobutanoate hydroxymethyltransferase [Alcanivorax sp.]MBM1145270.1 3-methyl-2-oxobutanoate hydroxymethyltransferase [Alcanivorax sp. ZXX171]MCQ6263379.1 3-methyl-2-oxobutanoate hydroxymethyltransferase [Alcanivorax sp. MM125-6]MAY11325.1 3-methyl-2-oxobutanoate hydroxymethyltransferase [Alcanivorax sp.]MBU60771.1 3-methyl-2-oxobutanoate hydroxymethyltransferase [Alcanivorax sp.]|tara:strand:+ start:18607 stop:19395 length:789 start_codon:yes stop_codon:yes gene_type:complete